MQLRSVIFLCLLASFAILAPYLLLRATGHRIDLQQRKIVSTGAIAVTIFPVDSEIRFRASDKERGHSKHPSQLNPTVLQTNLLPATYFVEARTPGRIAWQKTVPVEESKTSSYPFVRLLPEIPVPSGVLSRTPAGLSVNEGAKALIGWDSRGLFGMTLDGAQTKLTSIERILAGDVQEARWLPRTKSLLVQFRNGNALLFSGIRNSEEPLIIPLPQNIQTATEYEDRVLVAQTGTDLLRIDTHTPALILSRLAEHVAVFAVQDKRIAYMDTHGILWFLNGGAPMGQQRTVTPFTGNVKNAALLLGNDEETVLLRDGDGSAWLLESGADRFAHIADGIRDIEISHDATKALLVGQHELSFIALKERLDQPKREKGSRETIARFNDAIADAAFLPPENEHAAVLAGGTLHVIELDGRGGRNETRYPNTAAFAFAAGPARLILISNDGSVGILTIPLPGLLDRIGPQAPQ